MPEGVGKAFGLNSGFTSAEAFISGEYYGLILVLILSIVCVQMSTQLMARLVDRGSMAYLLIAPTTRRKVATTQAFVLTTALLLIMGVTTLAGLLGKAWFLGSEYEFNSGRFTQLNSVAFLLFFAVGDSLSSYPRFVMMRKSAWNFRRYHLRILHSGSARQNKR